MNHLQRTKPALRRSWLFLAGADRQALLDGARSDADVLVQELETFTPPARRPEARALSGEVLGHWRQSGILSAVRVNPLDHGGMDDLEAVMQHRPDIIMMSFISTPTQVVALDQAVTHYERE